MLSGNEFPSIAAKITATENYVQIDRLTQKCLNTPQGRLILALLMVSISRFGLDSGSCEMIREKCLVWSTKLGLDPDDLIKLNGLLAEILKDENN